MSPDLLALRERLARLETGEGARAGGSFPLGGAPGATDGLLALARGALHEVVAPGSADAAAAAGFALGLALRAAEGRPLLWARQDFIDGEAGLLSGMGLAAFGLDPAALVAVRARDATGVLRALAEGGRSPALGAAIGEIWGDPPVLDLTASRRLSLAARGSGVTLILLRLAAARSSSLEGKAPSAAETRFEARAAPSSSLEANAPGAPAFAVTLLRQRAGIPGRRWHLEWDRDHRTFRPIAIGASRAAPLPRPVAPLPAGRPDGAAGGVRRAG